MAISRRSTPPRSLSSSARNRRSRNPASQFFKGRARPSPFPPRRRAERAGRGVFARSDRPIVQYHLNFNFVWKYFDKLSWGLVLSLELALIGIVIGMAIGLALALLYTGGGRLARTAIASYVEFVRNVALLLLVYLVFYGIPSV